MALGGYKFVGYKYTRPADYDSTVDAQVLAETLKMHKCKLKAFTESCAASGAEWDFSYSNGDYAFGTHGNVIYKLDSSGFNLVSFFRYGTDDAYYAIVTLNDVSTGTGYSLQLLNQFYYYYGSQKRQSNVTNDMSCVGLVDLNMTNINVRPTQDRLALASDTSDSVQTSSGTQCLSKGVPEARYYGYATKGKCIFSFIYNTLSNFVIKISAIDSLLLSSPNDTKNIFSWTFGTSKLTSTSSNGLVNHTTGYFQTLKDNGVCYETMASYGTNYKINLYIEPTKNAVAYNSVDNIPYESATITTGMESLPANGGINSDGIVTKGSTSIDMIAQNVVTPYSNINPKVTYANGNYLNVYNYIYTIQDEFFMLNRFYYIGWDPSNPDITQESAWTAYTE